MLYADKNYHKINLSESSKINLHKNADNLLNDQTFVNKSPLLKMFV